MTDTGLLKKQYSNMETIKGWWILTITDVDGEVDRDDDCTLEHIGDMIKKGFTQGEIIQDKEEEAV